MRALQKFLLPALAYSLLSKNDYVTDIKQTNIRQANTCCTNNLLENRCIIIVNSVHDTACWVEAIGSLAQGH